MPSPILTQFVTLDRGEFREELRIDYTVHPPIPGNEREPGEPRVITIVSIRPNTAAISDADYETIHAVLDQFERNRKDEQYSTLNQLI